MEKLKELIKQEQAGKELQTQRPKSLVKINNRYALDVYRDPLTPEGLAKASLNIQNAFPELPDEFYLVLFERIKQLNKGDSWMMDAVNNVIDNCIYPRPTVANFLSWDKKVELFTYDQMLAKNDKMQGIFKLYTSIKIDGLKQPLWASNQDVEKYKLTPFKK